jgi:hypothetical protein
MAVIVSERVTSGLCIAKMELTIEVYADAYPCGIH